MKRDIKINYGKIEDIISELEKYYHSLTKMKDTLTSIKTNLEKSESKAITVLLENFSITQKDILTCQKELDDVKKILKEYIEAMSQYALPIQRGILLQIDRNDIWANLYSVDNFNEELNSGLAMGYYYYGSHSTDENIIDDEKYNANRIDELNDQVERHKQKMNGYMEQLWDIYNNRIVPFENTDDDYKNKAWDLYWKYTGFGDWIGDFFTFLGDSLRNLVSGILDALKDLVVGLYTITKGVVFYLGSGIVVLVTSPFGTTPDWASNYFDGGNDIMGTILNDPMILIEGISQGVSDGVDTKGIAYSTGYIVGSLIGTKGLDKAGKAAKGLVATTKVKIVIQSLDDLVKLGYSVDDLAKIGIQSYDDVVRLGLDKLDDAAKVKTELDEIVKGASGANADFYVAPNGKVLPGKYKDWIGTNMRDSVMNSVDDVKLKNAIGEVYRPGSVIGDGGTADVIRFERETGILLSKSGHVKKGVDMSKYFQKLLDSGTLSAKDAKVASNILEDLKKALGGK